MQDEAGVRGGQGRSAEEVGFSAAACGVSFAGIVVLLVAAGVAAIVEALW